MILQYNPSIVVWERLKSQNGRKIMTFYSFLKNYSTSGSNILRENFYRYYLQTM